MPTYDALIIGAGSVGVPLSWELARRGWSVGVLERLPSAGRGQNRAAIGGLRATHSDRSKIRIGQRSLQLVQALEKSHGFQVDWIQGGYLFPVYDEGREKSLRSLLQVQKTYGLDIDWVEPDRIQELVPGINPNNLRGGTFSPGDGSASPLKVSEAYYMLAMEAGVHFHFGEKVAEVKVEGSKITAVRTNAGSYSAAIVVDASGAGARELGQLTGLDIPVFPDSHEAGITEPVRRFFEPMVVDIRPEEGSANYYFYQNREGQVVFCITPDPKILGQDIDNTSVFLPQVVRRMVSLYPRLRSLRVRRTWRGLYPMTPDGSPVVGPVRTIDNLWLAVGMCGQGFMLGPGVGEILARILADGSHEWDFVLEQLSLYRRFEGSEVLK